MLALAKPKQKLSAGAKTAKLNKAANGLLRERLKREGRFDEYSSSTRPSSFIPDKRGKSPKHKGGKDDYYI